jgi:hypothetical protein
VQADAAIAYILGARVTIVALHGEALAFAVRPDAVVGGAGITIVAWGAERTGAFRTIVPKIADPIPVEVGHGRMGTSATNALILRTGITIVAIDRHAGAVAQ